MATDELTVERRGGTAIMTLCAPERRNALSVPMAEAMISACDELDADPSVGAVIVTGAGGYFCAGADRAQLSAAGLDPAEPELYQDMGKLYASFARVGALQAPTIAAIQGGAVGAGLNLALATDLRVIAQDAKLLSGFLQIGIHPGGGHSALLARATGREAANAMQLFGQVVTGTRAAELGLAWAAVPAGEVLDTALELTKIPAADPELARRTTKSMRTIAGPPALPWDAALDLERASQMWSLRRREVAAQGS